MKKENAIIKSDISEIQEQKWWKLKKWDIALVTKKEYDKWVSIIWKVLFIDDEKIKLAVVVSDWNKQKVEIFESRLDNEQIKLSFWDKDELMSTIFDLKQKARKTYEESKRNFEDSRNNIINFEKDLSHVLWEGELSNDIIVKTSLSDQEITLEQIPF